jgi:hypothetical protein
MEYLAPPALRFLGTRATVVSGDPGNSLAGINTANVMDGAMCYVQENQTQYVLDKSSTLSPFTLSNTIVAPFAGPGRWFALSGATSTASFTGMVQMQGDTGQTLTIGTQDQWEALSTGSWTYTNATPANVGGTPFVFTAPSPELTYLGPNRLYKLWAIASIGATEATPGNFEALEIAADVNNALVGGSTDPAWAQRGAIGDGPDVIVVESVRIVGLVSGDILNIAFRNHSGTHDIDVAYFTLLAEPVV